MMAVATRVAVVDGNEVAWTDATTPPKISMLMSMVRTLERYRLDPIVVMDGPLYHAIANTTDDQNLLERCEVRECPAGTEVHQFLLTIADEASAVVISNEDFPELGRERRRIPYRVYRGKVYLDPEPLMGVF